MAASSSSGSSTHPLIRRPEELGYWNPARLRHFVETAEERWDAVCQILRSDKPGKGTGCLIGGNFLITNHHVIESIEAARNATACFFQVISQTTRKEKTVVRIIRIALNPDRYFFTCHAKVSGIFKVPQPADEDHLDFTIVAMQRDSYLSSIQQKAFSIFKPFAHFEEEEIYIIHHPDRINDETVIADPETALRGDVKVSHGLLKKVYPYYVHYSTSAHRGSSGGAAINVEGQIIALHYQTIRTCREGCRSGFSCYSGIRMDQIVSYLAEKGQTNIIEDKIQEDREHYRSDLSNHLIEYYRQKLKTSVYNTGGAGDWTIDFPIEGIYTNLAIIGDAERKGRQGEKNSFEDRRIPTHETLYKSKVPVQLEELFNSGRLKDAHKKQAVIFGVAGVGKTTFCEMAAIKGTTLWPQFSTVFLIKLRRLNRDNYPPRSDNLRGYTVYEVLARECGFALEDFEEVLKLELFKKDSLLILDGFDELPPEAQSQSGPLESLIKDLMETFNHVLITSRPMRVSLSGLDFQCKFEITGFNSKNINCYIDKFYRQLETQGKLLGSTVEEKIRKFKLGLQSRPLLHNLVQIPINLTLACSIFNDNEAAFDIPQGFSLTSFYILTIRWLYNRFLSRSSIPRSLSFNLEDDPILNSLIEPIDRALQSIAWLAMKKNVIQLQERDVYQMLKQSKVEPRDLKNVGLMKFENRNWEFIHLTFQEYFAAVYLAGFYINGKTKKEKRKLLEKGKKRLIKIKFDPRYTLTLWMIAGYLSDRGDTDSLRFFFNHLFDKPRDFAKHYEFRLFAQCFEECSSPKEISQYPAFIEACTNHIRTASSKNIFNLLNRNIKLVADGSIVDAIYARMNCLNELMEMIEVLYQIASNRQYIPDKLVGVLILSMKNSNLGVYIKDKVISILGKIAQGGGAMSEVAVRALMEVFKDANFGDHNRIKAASALKEIAKTRGVMSEAAMKALIEAFKDASVYSFIRTEVVSVLVEIAKEGGMMFERVIGVLMEVIKDVNLDSFIRGRAASALVEIASEERVMSEAVTGALMEVLKDANLGNFSRGRAVDALVGNVKGGGVVSEAVMGSLMEVLKDANLDSFFRKRAVEALREIAQGGGLMSEAAMGALVRMLKDV